MKKILCLLFFIFLFTSCKSNQKIKLEVASEIENQIQNIDEFRLDKIVLKATYANRNVQYMVVTEDMVEGFDTSKRGKTELVIKFMGEKLFLDFVLYDEEFLKVNYIFYWDYKTYNNIMVVSSYFDIPKPQLMTGFSGWYLDKERKIQCVENPKNRIVKLYPLITEYGVCEVKFYEGQTLAKKYYLFYGEKIPYYTPDIVGFSAWSRNDMNASSSMEIHSICLQEDEVIVYFYNKEKIYEKYEIHKKNTSINTVINDESPYFQSCYVWSSDVSCLKENISIYPVLKNYYIVTFHLDGQEYIQNVLEGEDAILPFDEDFLKDYTIIGSYKHVFKDSDVYLTLKAKYRKFYLDGRLINITSYTNEEDVFPSVPWRDGYTGEWEEIAPDEYQAVYKKILLD